MLASVVAEIARDPHLPYASPARRGRSSTDALTADIVHGLARGLRARVVETHISWVLLAGDRAYKIKKPVRLPFVDYGTLDSRRHFCEEEVRLNQRLAPGLYLGVTRITGTRRSPQLDGRGPLLEYAVCMARFAPGALFSERIEAGALLDAEVDALALLLADFHTHAPVATASDGLVDVAERRNSALAALAGVTGLASVGGIGGSDGTAALAAWLEREADVLEPLWTQRMADGHVRECHGDLHLDNVVAWDGQVIAFDCVEFSPVLRWIDVIDDLAFAVMDFDAFGRRDFAFRLLNRWLDHTGDHAALPALPFAVVYRALVRAQVEGLRGAARAAAARRYLARAEAWTRPRQARLVITHGLPGSGKTTQSQQWLEANGAIRLRSDVERKRLFGLAPTDCSQAQGVDIYRAEDSARVYAHLLEQARALLAAGYPVIVDAAFLRRAERADAQALALSLGVPFSILACSATMPVLRKRICARKGDASEADVQVLERLATLAEPLTRSERAMVLPVPLVVRSREPLPVPA